MSNIIYNIRKWLEIKGYSMKDAAHACGYSRQHLYNILDGTTPVSPELANFIQDDTGGKIKRESLIWEE